MKDELERMYRRVQFWSILRSSGNLLTRKTPYAIVGLRKKSNIGSSENEPGVLTAAPLITFSCSG
jgi:hypothetical protein